MKLITLNIWGGHVYQPLRDFIQAHQDVEIFCLQEVYHEAKEKISREDRILALDIFNELQELLPDHQGFFRPVVDGCYGLAMLVSKKLSVVSEGEFTIHHNPSYEGFGPRHSRILQWVECQYQQQVFSVINVHGLWNGQGKTDTPERIEQSKRINQFLRTIDQPKILCGDFNLRPDTESLTLAASGLIDLVKQFNIQSTRTSLYPKEEKFADYIFISPEIQLNHFEVLASEVSDHAPLLLDFALDR